MIVGNWPDHSWSGFLKKGAGVENIHIVPGFSAFVFRSEMAAYKKGNHLESLLFAFLFGSCFLRLILFFFCGFQFRFCLGAAFSFVFFVTGFSFAFSDLFLVQLLQASRRVFLLLSSPYRSGATGTGSGSSTGSANLI